MDPQASPQGAGEGDPVLPAPSSGSAPLPDPESAPAAGCVRVVTVEDDERYRVSLEALLRHSTHFTPVGGFGSGEAAVSAAERARAEGAALWDLVLMDLDLPGMNGIDCTGRLKALLPDASVVVLTVFEERARILEAICAGADGYLLKRTPADQLLAQLRSVVAGGSPLSAGVARTVLDLVRQIEGEGARRGERPRHPDAARRPEPSGAARIDLTPREREVLSCLVQGMSYKGAASHLGISIDTVRTHIREVYRKLQVHSVAEAVSRAFRDGLV
jgi:two-component system, NarL family, nitrate/nitrite response regulator NarL